MPTFSRCRRSPHPGQHAFGPLSCLIALCCLALTATAVSAEDGAPLQLDSEHLGMTSEGMSDVERHAETERRVDEAIEKSEWSDADLESDTEAELAEMVELECPVPALAPVGAGPAPIEVKAIGVTDFGSCVEVAIRSGNGFKAASSVCQTLFPEAAVDADAGAGAGAGAADAAVKTGDDATVNADDVAPDDLSGSPTSY